MSFLLTLLRYCFFKILPFLLFLPLSPSDPLVQITSCKIAKDGKFMLTASGDICKAWDLNTHAPLCTITHATKVFFGFVFCFLFCFLLWLNHNIQVVDCDILSHDNHIAITQDSEGALRQWDILNTAITLNTLPINVCFRVFFAFYKLKDLLINGIGSYI
jgi:hypothetical protein